MKTIVVPTDFSSPAENAMLFAGELANRVQASVLLLHIYQLPVSMNEMPVLMIPGEELKNAADEGLDKAKEVLKKRYASLDIKTESRMGDVIDELSDVCKQYDPLAVIVGKHGATGVERFLFGNTSLSIIRHSSVPVIAVPDLLTEHHLKNVVLAVDALDHSIPQQRVKEFVEEIDAHLFVVHVHTDKSRQEANPLIAELNASYTVVQDEEFVHGIEKFVADNSIDMIIIIPHKHSLVERMFFKTHTKDLMEKISIPVMCMPES
jgi:nucleotide-binding universal stress UspA family protein